LKVILGQYVVSSSTQSNLAQIEAQLDSADQNSWVIFPEGMLSGYEPRDPEYIKSLDPDGIMAAIATIQQTCSVRNCNCVLGTAFPYEGRWYNASVAISGGEKPIIYLKNSLARLDHAHFTQGNLLKTYSFTKVTFGIQMCRELLFPEQWRALKLQGAQLVFHINNAIQPQDAIWRHMLITRALENQIYIVSVNNPASPQALPSCVISPTGQILVELSLQQEQAHEINLDLSQVSHYYVEQMRSDLVRLVL